MSKIDETTQAIANTLNGIRSDRDRDRAALQEAGLVEACESATVSGGFRLIPLPSNRDSQAYRDATAARKEAKPLITRWRQGAAEFNCASNVIARFLKAQGKVSAKQS